MNRTFTLHTRAVVRTTVALLLAALVAASVHPAPVVADPPLPRAHVLHPPPWYEQNRLLAPTGPTENLLYNGGPVMHTATHYAIFWAPAGHAIPTGYQNLIIRYFQDVGGTPFYGILTQYCDGTGSGQQFCSQIQNPVYIQNSAAYGGDWVDTQNAYPHAGTTADPLQDTDMQAEVRRALQQNNWPSGLTNMYFVFTAQGIESCLPASGSATSCTPGIASTITYCAYHSFYTANNSPVVYANMPYDETWTTNCRTFSISPNGNLAADAEISTTAHEQFEAVTDPEVNSSTAWNDTVNAAKPGAGEIGDKCAYRYLSIFGDGANVTLGSNKYIVQSEWSNAAFDGTAYSGCVLPQRSDFTRIARAANSVLATTTASHAAALGASILHAVLANNAFMPVIVR